MMNENSVIFKARKEGIVILLDKDASLESIKEELKIKIMDSQGFFGDARVPVLFEGRELTADEEKELFSVIAESSNMKNTRSDEPPDISPGKLSKPQKTTLLEDDKLISGKHMTAYLSNSVRSGQIIRYSGSIVLMGDVNPGAEIIAGGNIIVMGTIKGMVHAGCNGNRSCFITALNIVPTQLRIADVIIYIPPEMLKANKRRVSPVHAYVNEGQIYIELLG